MNPILESVFASGFIFGIICFIVSGAVFIYGINDIIIDFDKFSFDITYQPPMLFLSLGIFILGIILLLRIDYGFSP